MMLIEDNVPMPEKSGMTATLRKLKLGQSVVLNVSRGSVAQAARAAGLVGKYSARIEGDGFRVWRIKD